MAVSHDYLQYVLEQLAGLGRIASRRMGQFRPYADKPEFSMSYFEVPAEVLEDGEECVAWARRSVAVALAAPKPGSRRTPAAKPRTRGAKYSRRAAR